MKVFILFYHWWDTITQKKRYGWKNDRCHICGMSDKSSIGQLKNCSHLYQLNFHWHVDGAQYFNGMGVSKDQRILPRKTWTRISGNQSTYNSLLYIKCQKFYTWKYIWMFFHNQLSWKVVDMRWGVRDEMTNEHMTTDLCMTELRNCQRLSMGPNFIYFGGTLSR